MRGRGCGISLRLILYPAFLVLGALTAGYAYGLDVAAAFLLICMCFYTNVQILFSVSAWEKTSRNRKVLVFFSAVVCNGCLGILVGFDPLIMAVAWAPGIAATIAARI